MKTLLKKLMIQNQQPKRKQAMKTTVTKTSMILSATALMTAMTFTSCNKESELDAIKDAQMCLNTATTATAQSCVAKLSAIATEQASQLKCAAYFIQEGFGTPSALIDAIDAAEGASCTGCSGSMNIISALKFSAPAQSSAAFEVCSTSGIPVYSQLSSLVQISTLANAFGASATTPAQFETAITSMPATMLGEVVLTAFESSCTGESGSGAALQKFCGELKGAVAEATPADVGTCLKYKLTGDNYPGLPCPLN